MHLVGDEEDVVESEPVLARHVPEACPVLVPAAAEGDLPGAPALDDHPSPRGRVHVAVHRDGAVSVERGDEVHPTVRMTIKVDVLTV